MRFIFIFYIFFGFIEGAIYHNYNNQLVRCINSQIRDFWCLHGGMCGGKLSPTLEVIDYAFWSNEHPSKERARQIFLEITDYILFNYNSSERLRPFLVNYPFNPRNVEVTIFFYKVSLEGEIETVSGFKDKIFYKRVSTELNCKQKLEYEDFDETYYSVYGKMWDPFKYGNTLDNDIKSCE